MVGKSVFRRFLLLICILIVISGTWFYIAYRNNQARNNNSTSYRMTPLNVPKKKTKVPVVAVGGSISYGWDDKSGGGFLPRMFASLSKDQGVDYQLVNKSVEGDGPLQIAPKYASFLKQYHPKIVVLAWGLLDDISKKTPIGQFQAAIQAEISSALAAHATVWIVTPPVTNASYTGYTSDLEPKYVTAEVNAAKKVNSSQVQVFDLLHMMKTYISEHGGNYKQYAGDGWHPNTAGHILAAKLFEEEVLRRSH